MNNFILHRTTIKPEWVDYNGHLSEAYYVLIFGHSTDAFLDCIGMDDTYRRENRCSVYTLEAHLHYWREITAGKEVAVRTQILGRDAKRLLIHHTMLHENEALAATELMLIYVEKEPLRTAPLPGVIADNIECLWLEHKNWPDPKGRARQMGVRDGF